MLHSLKRNAEGNGNVKQKLRKISMSPSQIIQSPVKSFSDKKEYRLIKLPNGLSSLLIRHFIEEGSPNDENHDDRKVSESSAASHNADGSEESASGEEDEDEDEEHKEKLAAVALCIKVGSFFDPSNIQGLSHFLEHMIFMGSEKYPKENEFDQFVSTNGGADNAMTECEYTMFYFEIVEEHLAGAIDRFAQLFVSPLMLRDSMEREMEAVESEFQNNIAEDSTRIMQLCASLANGPANTFTWGNLKTLKEGISNEKLYTAVHDFRRKHYLANRMYLCVESSQPLEELQTLVEDNFAAITSGPDPEPLKKPECPFQPEFFEKVYYVKPKADKIKFYMTFVLPSLDKHYKSKPHDYLAYIIQHEGVGSLSSYLKRKLLALRVEAGTDDQSFEGNSMFTLFYISVTLTEDGYKSIDTVLDAVFSFLLVLKDTSLDDHKKAYTELKQIKDTSFKFREEKSATDNVEELAVNMMYYDSRDIITGSDIFFKFDGEIIQDLIGRLNEKKFNLMILTDKHEQYEKTEKWFGTEYDEIDFPESITALWNNRQLKPYFSMPPSNDFICHNFDIIGQDLDSVTSPRIPEKVLNENGCELFYKLDAQFKLPHAYIYCYLVSPKTISSVRNMVLTSLYSMITKHYMTEKLYPAVCAGLGYELFSEEKGMLLKLSGYNEKLPFLLIIITNELKNISGLMQQPVFETYRKQFKKFCYNNLINSKFFNKDCRLNIVEEDHKFYYDRCLEADKISFADLVEFSEHFLDQLKIQILVQGNMSKLEAIEVGKTVVRNLSSSEIDKDARIESRTRKLPVGTNVLHVKSMLPNDKNSTVTNYVQVGPSTIRLQCLMEFIEKIIEEPMFDILRTQQQLGYMVSVTHRYNHGVLGLSFTIQSQENKHPTTVVDERIEQFSHEHMLTVFESMTDEKFETIQNSLIKLKKMVEVELESEVNRHWSEITSSEYIFNRLELEAQMIALLTKNEVVDFYKSKIIADDARKLSIQVIGIGKDDAVERDEDQVPNLQVLTNHHSGERQNVITDIEAFVKPLELYPVLKTVIDE